MSRYATTAAVDAARSLGIEPRQTDFRDVFLHITESVCGIADTATFIGRTRTAERWAVPLCGVLVEVIHDPEASTSMITAVMPSRKASGSGRAA